MLHRLLLLFSISGFTYTWCPIPTHRLVDSLLHSSTSSDMDAHKLHIQMTTPIHTENIHQARCHSSYSLIPSTLRWLHTFSTHLSITRSLEKEENHCFRCPSMCCASDDYQSAVKWVWIWSVEGHPGKYSHGVSKWIDKQGCILVWQGFVCCSICCSTRWWHGL